MRVNDKVVVVTGASSGIGRATALALAREGAVVVLAARREAALKQVADECVNRGGRAVAVATDVTDAAAVQELARRAVSEFGRVDAWVNCAAVTLFAKFTEAPLADFRRVLDTNVMGYVHGARAALPHLRERGCGVLVNVSSVVGGVTQPYTHAYVMAKWAVRALSASLRQELAVDGCRGVKVCTVLPATIDTPLFAQAANYTGRKVLPMPPVHPAEQVARAVVDVIRAPRREVVVGAAGRGLMALARLAPGLTERILAVQVDRAHLSRTEPASPTSGNLYQPAAGLGAVAGGWRRTRKPLVRRAVAAVLVAGAAVATARRLRRG